MKLRLKHSPIGVKRHREYFYVSCKATSSEVFARLPKSSKYLYFVLCKIWSRKERDYDCFVKVRDKEIEEYSGLSRSTIFLARKALVKAGLIEEGGC